MRTLHYQPAIEPQRSFGESPFRLEPARSMPQMVNLPNARARQLPFVLGASFALASRDDLWANRPTVGLHSRRRRFPVVAETGRVITQQEIDDALDD